MSRFAVGQLTSLSKKRSRLRAIAANALDEVGRALEETADSVIADAVSNYDSAQPGENYQRTYNMAGSWTRSSAFTGPGGTVQVVITNFVTDEYGRDYSGLVQGDRQTFRHSQAGWRTIGKTDWDDGIASEHSHEQSNRVRAAINRAGNR